MLYYSPTQRGGIILTGDLALLQENKTYTDLGSDWRPGKQGLVCRSSNRQSPLHQSSSDAAPMMVVPGEENRMISLKNHKLLSYKTTWTLILERKWISLRQSDVKRRCDHFPISFIATNPGLL